MVTVRDGRVWERERDQPLPFVLPYACSKTLGQSYSPQLGSCTSTVQTIIFLEFQESTPIRTQEGKKQIYSKHLYSRKQTKTFNKTVQISTVSYCATRIKKSRSQIIF